MTRYFLRSLGAHLRSGAMLHALAAAGVALGVASILCILVINRSALAAFAGSVKAVSGDAALSVLGRVPAIPESLYPVVLATPGVAAAWPVFRTTVAIREPARPQGSQEARPAAGRLEEASGSGPGTTPRMYLQVLGLDLFAATGIPWSGAPGDASRALAEPGWAAFSPDLARERGWRQGDAVEVAVGSRPVTLRVGALVDFRARTPLASTRLVLMDIAQAQALLGERGQIHGIDVRVTDGAEAADVEVVRQRLEERLGPAVRVLAPEQRQVQAAGLLGAFRLNLTALSLVSLFVGLFLVHSSTQASLVRRRKEMGLLRSLGATRGQVLGLVLGEAALLGLTGTLAGIPLGIAAARASVRLVSATISNLYLLERIERLDVPPSLLVLAVAVGMGGAVLGGLLPALDLARRDTKTLLETLPVHERVRSLARPLALAGLVGLGLSAIAFAVAGDEVRARGFILAAGLLLALPLLTPFLVETATERIRPRRFGLAFALRGLGARLQTTSFAVASLAVAVSMLVGITLMVGSFRRTLEIWIAGTVHADVYVAAASYRGDGPDATLDEDLVRRLGALPGVVAVDRLRGFLGYTGDRRIAVTGVDLGLAGGERRFALVAPSPADALLRARTEGGVLVSEALARKLGLRPGDRLPLATLTGEALLPIAAVFYDYATENGSVVMDLATLERHFGPGEANRVALYLARDREAEAIADAVRGLEGGDLLAVRSNRDLRLEILRIFDQTFAVTRLLQAMSLLIAACGITLTLLVLAREQEGEIALYRALGARRAQVFGVYVGKGLGIGIAGLAIGVAGGAALAAVLVLVINRAYFGWTIQPHGTWGSVALEGATILAAAVLASLHPAARASTISAAALSRTEG